ncbi:MULTISPECIES: hypothetical protein [unclassified Pseudomonas]|jgi:hypothetical protein|uniref:hypothetical protein n=1 Tax=unclassified Pseudomonas TaxID=196821 RepID=UPI00069CDE12|nr:MULTISPECIES: hypothetical protein [unclassified Pseudomonas]WPN49181.1 hypothetical protein QMK58_11160 [Pseudomonas sp. P8_241]WPN49182.1 hypothetical protein QMK58_11165 [Pseudomonas sp. P8_241]
MSTTQECVGAEKKRLYSAWKLRAVLFGTDFVVLTEKGKIPVIREAYMKRGCLTCLYGNGDWGPVRLYANGHTSDANFEWAPLTKEVAQCFGRGAVTA